MDQAALGPHSWCDTTPRGPRCGGGFEKAGGPPGPPAEVSGEDYRGGRRQPIVPGLDSCPGLTAIFLRRQSRCGGPERARRFPLTRIHRTEEILFHSAVRDVVSASSEGEPDEFHRTGSLRV